MIDNLIWTELGRILGPGAPVPQDRPMGEFLDSLDRVVLAVEVETVLGITITETDIETRLRDNTVAQFIQWVRKRYEAKP